MSITITTHDNLFHLDDLFACAVLQMMLEAKGQTSTIVRTRSKELVAASDYVVDVGDIYDVTQKRFDHHQKGGAGVRDNGIPYASIGLVWKEYGAELCGSAAVAQLLDEKLFQYIDADDNGMNLYKNIRDDVDVVSIHTFFYAFRPTWKEDPANFDTAFAELLPLAKKFIIRKIKRTVDKLEAQTIVENAYTSAADKRLIIMDKPYPGDEFLMSKPEPLFKISPNSLGTVWGVKTFKKSKDVFENRKDLPAAWRGLTEQELQALTGVPDAIFCHNALFLATAASREGAIALAKLALDA